MFDVRKKAQIEAKVFDYTITLFIKDNGGSKILYLDYSDYLSSEFFIKEVEGDFALMMKCEDERIEKTIHLFEEKKDAEKALTVLANAMMAERRSLFSRVKTISKLVLKISIVLFVLLMFAYLFMTSGNIDVNEIKAQQERLSQEAIPQGKPVPLEDMLK